jgi:hypothetical protein
VVPRQNTNRALCVMLPYQFSFYVYPWLGLHQKRPMTLKSKAMSSWTIFHRIHQMPFFPTNTCCAKWQRVFGGETL